MFPMNISIVVLSHCENQPSHCVVMLQSMDFKTVAWAFWFQFGIQRQPNVVEFQIVVSWEVTAFAPLVTNLKT